VLLKGAARETRARETTGLRPATQRTGINSFQSPCGTAAFVVNSEPHAGARPSVRLCVGPELARCVHKTVTVKDFAFGSST
jgi:hypothetical protein